MDPELIRSSIVWLEACLQEIHNGATDRALNEDEQRRWTEGVTERDRLQGLENRHLELERMSRRPGNREDGDGARRSPNFIPDRDPFAILEDRGRNITNVRDRRRVMADSAIRAVEDQDLGGSENEAHFERLVKEHVRKSPDWVLNWIGRSREEYSSGWAKLMTEPNGMTLSQEERAAVAVGTNTQGGYLVPTHLDPTLILTNSGSANIMRGLASVSTLSQAQGNTWHGVTTAGVTASWDAEATEVSDDSPGFGTVEISTYKPQALVQATIEAFEDIAGLTSDVMMLFADARDRLEGAAHMVGTGSGQAKGIFVALDASTTVEITSTTAAVIGEVDVHALYKAVPQRWRGRGAWLMAPTYNLAIKRLGTAVSSSYSGDLTQPVTDRILGRPVYESDDCPITQTTTALDNEIIYGDFSNYKIVDKPGSTSVEFIPHLFNTANNLPDGRRAWYMHWRTGADATNILAFRLLQDKTSA